MNKYKQLRLEEREELYGLMELGWSLGDIGKKLKRNKGTLSRELKRNAMHVGRAPTDVYIPCKAQVKAEKRASIQRSQASWKGPEVYLYVREHLKEKQYRWSPEQIAGRISLDHPDLHVCHETIYSAIYAQENKKHELWRYLTVRRQRRMKKGGRTIHRDSRIPEAVSIDKRPKIVNRRKQIGHWETDNVNGKQTDKTALSVTVERKIKLTILSKLVAKTADEKTKKLFQRMAGLPDKIRKTMTADNGAENTNHKQITESLTMDVFFCHPYHSWERGTVENTNGRIRKFIPKGMSMDTITEKEIAAIEVRLNNTPRKCLRFKTPLEVLEEIMQNTKTSERCASS